MLVKWNAPSFLIHIIIHFVYDIQFLVKCVFSDIEESYSFCHNMRPTCSEYNDVVLQL